MMTFLPILPSRSGAAAEEVAEAEVAEAGVEHLVDNTCPGSYLNRQHLYRSYNNHQGLQNLED